MTATERQVAKEYRMLLNAIKECKLDADTVALMLAEYCAQRVDAGSSLAESWQHDREVFLTVSQKIKESR